MIYAASSSGPLSSISYQQRKVSSPRDKREREQRRHRDRHATFLTLRNARATRRAQTNTKRLTRTHAPESVFELDVRTRHATVHDDLGVQFAARRLCRADGLVRGDEGRLPSSHTNTKSKQSRERVRAAVRERSHDTDFLLSEVQALARGTRQTRWRTWREQEQTSRPGGCKASRAPRRGRP